MCREDCRKAALLLHGNPYSFELQTGQNFFAEAPNRLDMAPETMSGRFEKTGGNSLEALLRRQRKLNEASEQKSLS